MRQNPSLPFTNICVASAPLSSDICIPQELWNVMPFLFHLWSCHHAGRLHLQPDGFSIPLASLSSAYSRPTFSLVFENLAVSEELLCVPADWRYECGRGCTLSQEDKLEEGGVQDSHRTWPRGTPRKPERGGLSSSRGSLLYQRAEVLKFIALEEAVAGRYPGVRCRAQAGR